MELNKEHKLAPDIRHWSLMGGVIIVWPSIIRVSIIQKLLYMVWFNLSPRLLSCRSHSPICSRDPWELGGPHGPIWCPHLLPCLWPLPWCHPEERPQWGGDARLLRQQDGLFRDPFTWTVPVWDQCKQPGCQKWHLYGECRRLVQTIVIRSNIYTYIYCMYSRSNVLVRRSIELYAQLETLCVPWQGCRVISLHNSQGITSLSHREMT